MWTAFVWGFGASGGVAVSVLLFLVILGLLDKVTGKTAQKGKQADVNERSLEAMHERNEISEVMCHHLEMIAMRLKPSQDSMREESSHDL